MNNVVAGQSTYVPVAISRHVAADLHAGMAPRSGIKG
jgi:hypothetical protein